MVNVAVLSTPTNGPLESRLAVTPAPGGDTVTVRVTPLGEAPSWLPCLIVTVELALAATPGVTMVVVGDSVICHCLEPSAANPRCGRTITALQITSNWSESRW